MLALAVLAAIIPALVAGQTVPACALTCTFKLAAASTCGGVTNINCLCTNDAFQREVVQCYVDTCSPTDFESAAAYGAQTCAAVGVTINTSVLPAGVSGGASSAAGSNAVATGSSAPAAAAGSSSSSSVAAPAASSAPTGSAAGSFARGNVLISTVAAMVGVAGLAVFL